MTRGKYGRRAPSGKPAMMLGPLLTGTAPAHPVEVDYDAKFTGWNMLDNDIYGDCVAVAIANNRAETTAVLTGAADYPPLADVLAFYTLQNPGFPNQDEGMDIRTALGQLCTVGIGGRKALAFAKVDHRNHDELEAAIAIFGSVVVGVDVQQAQEEQFDAGQAWDYVAGSPDVGGHGMHCGGYGGKMIDELRLVTWASAIKSTVNWLIHQLDEAYVIIWPETAKSPAFLAGVDQTEAAAAYEQITGQAGPVPPPPESTVSVTLSPPDAAFLRTWSSQTHRFRNNKKAAAIVARALGT